MIKNAIIRNGYYKLQLCKNKKNRTQTHTSFVNGILCKRVN